MDESIQNNNKINITSILSSMQVNYLQASTWFEDFLSTVDMFHLFQSGYYCLHHSEVDILLQSDVHVYKPSAMLSCFNNDWIICVEIVIQQNTTIWQCANNTRYTIMKQFNK